MQQVPWTMFVSYMLLHMLSTKQYLHYTLDYYSCTSALVCTITPSFSFTFCVTNVALFGNIDYCHVFFLFIMSDVWLCKLLPILCIHCRVLLTIDQFSWVYNNYIYQLLYNYTSSGLIIQCFYKLS